MNIDAVKQGARDLYLVALDLRAAAAAGFVAVAQVAAWAGIHHEIKTVVVEVGLL